jgi:hypothetical protein
MGRNGWRLVIAGLVLAVPAVRADGPPVRLGRPQAETLLVPAWRPLVTSASFFQAQPEDANAGVPENGNGPANGNGGNGNGEEGPKHIRDNGFFVEEASNQEPGVVQHIFNWIHLWDRNDAGKTRDLSFAYIMELPLGSQTHQFSFTAQMFDLYARPEGGPATHQGGVGDTLLNYRYQLLANDDFLWAAPRFSLILPTGDERFGLGTGELGYQFNLPVSRYGESFDYHFNAGFTYVPDVSVPLGNGLSSPGQDLRMYNLGASSFWKPRTNLHFFVEVLALWTDELDERGFRDDFTQVFVNPGFRWAVCQLEEVEWVLGLSVPVGLTDDTPDIGFFAYMSVEHTFRKVKPNGGCR